MKSPMESTTSPTIDLLGSTPDNEDMFALESTCQGMNEVQQHPEEF
ncbi:hypothetical protein KJ865_15500 [Myxococcota bacterium]|nr:hypothetical protein [Myxococcota bacterium]